MSKTIIGIIALAAAVIILVSFAVVKIAPKKGATLLVKTDRETRETLLTSAKNYEKKGNYPKARDAFGKYLERLPSSADKKGVEKKIEDLNMKILFSDTVTDQSIRYEIKKGDTLGKIASRFNTTVELIKKANGLKNDIIIPGKFLKVEKTGFRIIVDKSDNTLTLTRNTGETVKVYNVSTGENLSTPEGLFKIEEKMQSPVWYKVGAIVEPSSPEYELGSRWMGLSIADYGIHGTRDESSIGKHITNGCVRMRNADVEELYAIVPSGTEVTIIE